MKRVFVVSCRIRKFKTSKWVYDVVKVELEFCTKEDAAKLIRRHYDAYQVEVLDAMWIGHFEGRVTLTED